MPGLVGDDRRLYELGFEHAPIGMALVSAAGRMLRVNSALCNLLGMDRDDLLATSFQSITHPDDLETDVELFEQTLDGKRDNYTIDKRYIRPDGTEVDARLSVSIARGDRTSPVVFVSQIVDRGPERALAETQALLEAVFEHAPMGKLIARIGDEGCTVVRANPAFGVLLGCDSEDLLGDFRQAFDFHPDHEAARDALLDALGSGGGEPVEVRMRRPDGSYPRIWLVPAQAGFHGDERLVVIQAIEIPEQIEIPDELRNA